VNKKYRKKHQEIQQKGEHKRRKKCNLLSDFNEWPEVHVKLCLPNIEYPHAHSALIAANYAHKIHLSPFQNRLLFILAFCFMLPASLRFLWPKKIRRNLKKNGGTEESAERPGVH